MKIKGIYSIKRFRILSKDKTHYHLVELYNDNSLECDCEFSVFKKRNCWHKIKVRDYLAKQKK